MSGTAEVRNLVDLLDQLIEPAEPEAVSLMPQTWGWAALGVVVLILAAAAGYRLYRRYRANAYRRDALRELDLAGDDPALIAEVLRRTALAAYPRGEVASLAGDDWLGFLDAQIPEPGFRAGPGRIIATAAYRPSSPEPSLPGLARRWVRAHRPERSA